MSNNPTRRTRNLYDRVIDSLKQSEKKLIQSLKVSSTDSSVTLSGLGGGSSAGGGNPGAQGGPFLPLAGGSMGGPIAYGPKSASTSIDGSHRGHLDISKDKGKFSSNVIINGGPSGWNLSYIDGDYWDGQILGLHVPLGETLIIQNDGNIQLPAGLTQYKIVGPIWFEVMFNSTLSPNGNSGGWEITNPGNGTQINGCDIATKCYVDHLFAVAGFNQLSVTETITESAWVCLACFFDAIIAGDTISETQTTTLNDDFDVVFVTSTNYHVFEATILGVSLMPVSFWGHTANWSVDNVLQGTVAIDGSGVFSFNFDPSGFGAGAHELEIAFGGATCRVSFVV